MGKLNKCMMFCILDIATYEYTSKKDLFLFIFLFIDVKLSYWGEWAVLSELALLKFSFNDFQLFVFNIWVDIFLRVINLY